MGGASFLMRSYFGDSFAFIKLILYGEVYREKEEKSSLGALY